MLAQADNIRRGTGFPCGSVLAGVAAPLTGSSCNVRTAAARPGSGRQCRAQGTILALTAYPALILKCFRTMKRRWSLYGRFYYILRELFVLRLSAGASAREPSPAGRAGSAGLGGAGGESVLCGMVEWPVLADGARVRRALG